MAQAIDSNLWQINEIKALCFDKNHPKEKATSKLFTSVNYWFEEQIAQMG